MVYQRRVDALVVKELVAEGHEACEDVAYAPAEVGIM
jgi:hypothetical protein